MKLLAAGVIAIFGFAFLVSGNSQGGDKPKHTIAEVMAKVHKVGLHKKVAEGKASAEEKAQLVEFYTSLSKNAPPKGDEKEWKQKTTALLEAAVKASKGDEKAAVAILKLANCAGCHKAHK